MVECIKKILGRTIMKKPTGQEVIDFLNSKWRQPACPYCGGVEWHASDKVFELREFNDGNLVLGGPNSSITPVIPITCVNCGNTVFINALTTGLLKE